MLKNAKKPVLGFAAFSGVGKTTLLRKLLPLLTEQGIRVGVIKHAHHDFDIDKPGKDEEKLGAQVLDDNVYRQGFMFKKEGNYIITAEFEAEGEPYTIDFPLRVGNPFPVGPLGIAVGVIVLVLVSVSILQRRKLLSSKLRNAHDEMRS